MSGELDIPAQPTPSEQEAREALAHRDGLEGDRDVV